MLYYTESLLYPIVTFYSEEFILPENLNGDINTIGSIHFHGISHNCPILIKLKNNGEDDIWGQCNFTIGLDSFSVEKPSLLMIQIYNSIEIEILLKILYE